MANEGIRTALMMIHCAQAVAKGQGRKMKNFSGKLNRNKRKIAFAVGGVIATIATGGGALVVLAPFAILGAKKLYRKIRLMSNQGTVEGFKEGTLQDTDTVLKTVRYSIQHGGLTKIYNDFKNMYDEYKTVETKIRLSGTLKCKGWIEILEAYNNIAVFSAKLHEHGEVYNKFYNAVCGELERMNQHEFTGPNVIKAIDLIQAQIDKDSSGHRACMTGKECCYMPFKRGAGMEPLKPWYNMRDYERNNEHYRDPLLKMFNDAANSPYVFGVKRTPHLKQTDYHQWIEAVTVQALRMDSLTTMTIKRETSHGEIGKKGTTGTLEQAGLGVIKRVGTGMKKDRSLSEIFTKTPDAQNIKEAFSGNVTDITNWAMAGGQVIVEILNNYWNAHKLNTRMTAGWTGSRPQSFTEYLGTLRGKAKGSLEDIVDEFVKLRSAHNEFMKFVKETNKITCCDDAFACAASILKRQKYWCRLGTKLPFLVEFHEQVWFSKDAMDASFVKIGNILKDNLDRYLYGRHPIGHCDNGKGFCYGPDPDRDLNPPSIMDRGPVFPISDEMQVNENLAPV
jgi:hypothetical protein